MRAAVIVPVYGQADLMGETVSSLLAQQDAEAYAILLVDDHCADPRTRRKAAILAAAHPGQVFYWRTTKNAGLSAIRNCGVRRALEFWPELEAVAFVDGDDKVFPRFVARGLELLRLHGGLPTADGGRVGWIYEDWSQFGTPENLHSPAPYSPLFALAGCQHTPGCFCSADMFRDGLWFDENRRGGDAEDWQFWVKCHAHGWRGHHVAQLGFRYRRRIGGLAFAGLQAAQRNRVLIQKDFPELYHPDHFLALETGISARHLILDGAPGAQLGLGGPRLESEELGALLVRVADLPTTPAPARALIFTGTAQESLAAAALLDWAAWFLEARDTEGVAAVTVERSAAPGIEFQAETARRQPGPSSVVSLPVLALARAVTQGQRLSDLTASAACAHSVLRLGPHAGVSGRDAPSLAAWDTALGAEIGRLDQPDHPWHRDRVWAPARAYRTGLGGLHLGLTAPLADPGARQASIIVVSAQDLAWRPADLGLAAVAAYIERRDGTPPALCVIGTKLPAPAIADLRLRSVFLLPSAEARAGVQPEGLLAAFGTIVTLDCPAIIPAMNGVRRFGCRAVAALPCNDLAQSNLAPELLNSFKAFHTVLVRADSQRAHVLALGCAREIVSRDLLEQEKASATDAA